MPQTEIPSARSTQTPATSGRPGDLPTWLTVIIITLCVAGGGALVWWYFKAPPRSVTITMQVPRAPDRARGTPGQRPAVVDWTNDVRPANNGSFQVRAGDARLRVTKSPGGQWTMDPSYRVALLPADQLKLLSIRFVVRRDDEIQRLKLTPEQVEALRKIRINSSMSASPQELKVLSEAWAAFDGARGPEREAAKAKLIASLDELGKKYVEPTKAVLTANVAAIREVLNDEQEKLLAQN